MNLFGRRHGEPRGAHPGAQEEAQPASHPVGPGAHGTAAPDVAPRPGGAPADTATREQVLAIVRQNPGCSLQELADLMQVTRTAAVYHVRRLEKQGLVRQVRKGRRQLHFPSDLRDPTQQSLLGQLRLRRAQVLLEELVRDPAASWRDLARRLDVTPRAVRWHIDRLEKEGLVRVREEDGRRHVDVLHPDLRPMVDLRARVGLPTLGKAESWVDRFESDS